MGRWAFVEGEKFGEGFTPSPVWGEIFEKQVQICAFWGLRSSKVGRKIDAFLSHFSKFRSPCFDFHTSHVRGPSRLMKERNFSHIYSLTPSYQFILIEKVMNKNMGV